MYEVFDHTADLGLRVCTSDREGLFVEGGRALTSVIVSNFEEVRPSEEVSVGVAGKNLEYLFVDWLDELLFLFESKRFLGKEFVVALEENGLAATVRGEPYDEGRHSLAHEVKAVTYHGLKVERSGAGWVAEVIVDI